MIPQKENNAKSVIMENMFFEIILFDFDLTLFDTTNCLVPSLMRAAREVCFSNPSSQEIKRLIGVPLEEQFDILSNHADRKSFPRFREVFLEERNELEDKGSILLPGVDETLKCLSAKYTLGIVSTGQTGRVQRTLDRSGLSRYFCAAGIVGSAANKVEGISTALNRLETNAAATVYLGDRPDDGIIAQKAGVSFIGVTSGAFKMEEFDAGYPVLTSVADLPKFLISKCHVDLVTCRSEFVTAHREG